MKKMKLIWTLLFAFSLLFSLSMVAFAESPPELIEQPSLVASLQAEDAPVQSLPETVEDTPDASVAPDPPEAASVETVDTEAEDAPAKKNGNTPYYVGAVFAVLVFGGVAVYCRCKGNGNR